MNNSEFIKKMLWVAVFGITMGYFEAAVVVYLRAIYYPDGFAFPLKIHADYIIAVELFREVASVFMLLAVAYLAGKKFWERFAYFMISFGIWDIFYYVWLKALLDWPLSLFEWDVLFLIPLPWIGPVIAPVSIAVLMIVFGIIIISLIKKGYEFRPTPLSYWVTITGIVLVLYSFMYDLAATLHQNMPRPYRYELLIAGNLSFIAAFTHIYVRTIKQKG